MELDEQTRELLDGKNFATVGTVNPDGSPQTSLVWIARAEDAVLFSTTAARRKTRNLVRNPAISLTVFDCANPYLSVDIQGTAEVVEDKGRAVLRAISHKYIGEDPRDEPEDVVRVVVRVTPTKVTGYGRR